MKSIDSACRTLLVFNWLQYYVPKHGPTSYLLIYTTAPSSFIRLSKKMRGKWNAQWFRIAVETVNTVRKQMDKADIWIITEIRRPCDCHPLRKDSFIVLYSLKTRRYLMKWCRSINTRIANFNIHWSDQSYTSFDQWYYTTTSRPR